MTSTPPSGGWLLALVLLLGAGLGTLLVLGQLRHDRLVQDLAAVRADVADLRERLDAPAASEDGQVGEEEVARFRRVKEVVDGRGREERFAELVGRQLDRLGVSLDDEQRRRIVALTMAFREKVLDAVQASATTPEDVSDRQARLETFREECSEAVYGLVPPAGAEKILERLGGYPGFRSDR